MFFLPSPHSKLDTSEKPIPVTPVAAVEERTRAEHANDMKGSESPSHPTHPSRYTTLNELTSW